MPHDENAAFEKLLDVVEKYVEAWNKAYNKIETLSKSVDSLVQEVKDLNNIIRQKPCINDTVQHAQLETKILAQYDYIKEKIESLTKKISDYANDKDLKVTTEKQTNYWIKLTTGIIVLIGTIIGILLAILKK